MRPDVAARLDDIDRAATSTDPGRAPMTEGQRRVIATAFEHAAPFTPAQRLRLLRLLRTSPNWVRLKASVNTRD